MYHPFWSEKVIAPVPSAIPTHAYNPSGIGQSASLNFVVRELIRAPGYCDHVPNPMPPIHVYGLRPHELLEREKVILEAAKREIEIYTRRGKTHTRRQKSTTPIVLLAVASWPVPAMASTPERERWQRRVVRMCKARFGKKLRSILAHGDENFWHLHVWSDDDGKSSKSLHAGFCVVQNLLKERPDASRKEQQAAYVHGMRHILEMYAARAGLPFGHHPSPSPRNRLSRPGALRDRQAKIEAAELELVKRKKAAEMEVIGHARKLREALAKLHKREAKVAALYAAVVDQIAVEDAVAQNKYQAPSIF